MATGRIPTTANSPLTVKGDLFGYSTTQARVPVGNDGETLVADSSTTTGLRYGANFAAGKNRIINGDFFINQRNFTSVTSSGTYTFDRWYTDFLGGTCTYTPQTFTPGAAPVAGYEGNTFIQIAISGQSGSNYAAYNTRIEDVRTLAGQTATLSFWARVTSGTPVIYPTFTQRFGTGGSPSGAVVTTGGTKTLSTTWTRYSVTVSIPSISGKTIGTTANTSSLEIDFMLSVGGVTAINNNTFQIWGVQLEAGSTATAFQTATGTIQGELAACQRYYTLWASGSAFPIGMGTYLNSTQVNGTVSLPVEMRTAPTLSIVTGTNFYRASSGGAGNDDFNSLTLDTCSTRAVRYYNASEAGGTSGQAAVLTTNNASAFLAFQAEL